MFPRVERCSCRIATSVTTCGPGFGNDTLAARDKTSIPPIFFTRLLLGMNAPSVSQASRVRPRSSMFAPKRVIFNGELIETKVFPPEESLRWFTPAVKVRWRAGANTVKLAGHGMVVRPRGDTRCLLFATLDPRKMLNDAGVVLPGAARSAGPCASTHFVVIFRTPSQPVAGACSSISWQRARYNAASASSGSRRTHFSIWSAAAAKSWRR